MSKIDRVVQRILSLMKAEVDESLYAGGLMSDEMVRKISEAALDEVGAGADRRRRRTQGMAAMIETSPTVRNMIGPTILLHSGVYFDFLDPASSPFTIKDIAHALAMICRFAGQCGRFYSVAEHSVYVSRLVPPEHALAGLMHDAAEAFIGDVSKPLKGLLSDYRVIEARVEAAVLGRFGVALPLPPSIKEADLDMLVTEQSQIMRNRGKDWDSTRGRTPPAITIECWPPEKACTRFVDRFYELTVMAAPR